MQRKEHEKTMEILELEIKLKKTKLDKLKQKDDLSRRQLDALNQLVLLTNKLMDKLIKV